MTCYDPYRTEFPKWYRYASEGEVVENAYVSLAGLGVGKRVAIRRVLDRAPEVLRHLAGMELTLGAELELVERHPFEGPLIVASGGKNLVVSPKLARHVFVEPVPVRGEYGAGRTGLPRRATLAKGSQ